ncbi:MAG: C25 family cysteine peptidase [Thermoplasmatota archaeon]
MKKIISIAMVLFLMISGITVVGLNATTNKDILAIKESYSLSELYVLDEGDFIFVDFEESTSFTSDVGYPEVPVLTKRYVLPFGAQITSLEVLFSNKQEVIIPKHIAPVEIPRPISEMGSARAPAVTQFYKNMPLFPEEPYEYTLGTGLDDEGNRVSFLSVICYPVRYNPSQETLFYSDEVEISVEYKEESNRMTFGDEYDMVIITPKKYSNNAQSLADHKNRFGLSTFVKTTEEIYSEYNKVDEAEEIKYFIKDAIEDLGVEFVLLLGDYENVPMRTTYIYMLWEGNWYNQTFITDLYYADVYDEQGEFSSWDSNGNGKFGEVYKGYPGDGDDFDLYPDVRVGRIACRSNLDARIVISKIINYETNAYGKAWSNRALLMGGDTFPGHGNIEGEFVTGLISEEIPDYEQIILWTSKGNYNPFTINLEITKGVGVVTYSGHGYQFGFGTSPPNQEERIEYYTPYTIGMLNINKYPIIFFDACSTAELDYRRYGIRIPTFAWYIVRKPIGGAIATIGATRIAYTYVNHQGVHGGAGYLNLHFFKAYEDGRSVAEVFNSAQNDYITHVSWLKYTTVKEFILIGDPSLRIGGYNPP